MRFGCLYLLTSIDHAARLVVSLFSLRRRYSGPVTIFATRSEADDVLDFLVKDERLAPLAVERLTEFSIEPEAHFSRSNTNYITKVLAIEQSPFDATLFLDADTLVVGDIQPLIDSAVRDPITVTQFSDWKTTDIRYRKHLETWKCLVESAPTEFALERRLQYMMTTSLPVINTGVVALRTDSELIGPWKSLASLGRSCHIPDEMALQLLLPDYEHCRLGTEFNCSPCYASESVLSTHEVRIWHFVNATHLRDADSRGIWLPAYDECFEKNIANISQWSRIVRPKD